MRRTRWEDEGAKGKGARGGPEAVDSTAATVHWVMMGLYRGRPPE